MTVIKEGFYIFYVSRHLELIIFIKSEHKQPIQRKITWKNLLGCSKNVGGINTYGIDRTIMTLHFSNWHKSIHVPKLQNAPSAATEQNRVPWYHS